jgi:hypothetical protein
VDGLQGQGSVGDGKGGAAADGGAADDFTVTVSWGDGTSSTGSVAAITAGTFAVLASHTFAEGNSNPLTLSVNVLDVGGATVSGSTAFTVADASLTLKAVHVPPSPTEGMGTGIFTLADFSDANTSAPLSDFTAVVAWGDGTTSTLTAASGAIVGSGGNYSVLASHTFAEQTTTPAVVSVQILDAGGSSVSGSSTPYVVADAPLALTAVHTPGSSLTEGKSNGTFTVATFTDANASAPLTDFTAIIAWGDGTTTTVTSANGITGANGSFAVQSSHTYEEIPSGTFVSVQVLDAGGSSVVGSSSLFTVADAPLTVTSVNAPNATEGQNTGIFTVATFSDANSTAPVSDFTAIVHWGDGTTDVITSANGLTGGFGNFAVAAAHTYLEGGTATLSVQVLDVGGASASSQALVPVADAPLHVTAVNTPAAGFTEGAEALSFTVATFNDGNTNAPVSDFTAVVLWGDSTTSTLTAADGSIVSLGGGNFAVLGGHSYKDEGNGSLQVRVTDVDGGTGSGSTPLSVADAPLNLVSLTPPAAFAQTDFRSTLAIFSDANVGASTGDFSAQVNWGDGTTTGGSIVSLGGGSFAIQGEHTYSGPGTFGLSISVQDRGGSTLSASGNALVGPTPTTITVTGISDHYSLFNQVETVTAQVNAASGLPVNRGTLSITDAGQTQVVQLVNGTATATFTFNIGHEVPNAHPIGLGFSDPSGIFVSSSASPMAPSTTQDYFFQLFEDLLLVYLFMHGSGG